MSQNLDFGNDSSMDMDMGSGGMGDTSGGSPTPGKNKKPFSVSKDTLLRLMNGFSNGKDLTESASTAYPTRYSHNTLVSRIRSTYVRPETPDKLNQQGLIAFVQPIHEEIARHKFSSNRFRILAPEIEQAALILVSSILSPNDLQTTKLKFDIKHDKLTEDTKEKICSMLESYFNETFDIGTKLDEWYKECLFKSGSQPVFILPDIKFEELKNRPISSTMNDSFVANIGTEGYINHTVSNLNTEINKILNTNVYSNVGTENYKISVESLKDLQKNNNKIFKKEFINPIMDDVRSIIEDDLTRAYPLADQMSIDARKIMMDEREKAVNNLSSSLENTTINIITKMNDGDVFRITENPEILRFHQNFSLQRKYNLTQKFTQFWNKDFIPYKNEPVTPISIEEPNEGKDTKTYPTVMVLPPESVIPICIPGDETQHIGYFLALDQFGHPLVAKEEEFDNSMCGNGEGAKAFNTLFGSAGQTGLFRLGDATRVNVVSKVYEHILDKYLKAKLDGLGIGDMDISQYNSIVQVMFRRLMFHKKTILVFIPDTNIIYYAFDYREDGTGKSKLENMDFILHLRTTFFVAKIMAMMKDAVDHRNVTVSMDDKVANPEQLLQQIKDLFIAQRSFIFNSNPADIVRTINDNSLSVSGEGIPGLPNFKIEHGQVSNTTQAPDDNLLDTLNTLFIDFLDVPHSALNQLSENEYSRSIVSNHLFFAKKIIQYQKRIDPINDKFVRVYTRYAKPLRVAIAKILNKDGSETDVVQTTTNGDASKITIDEVINAINTSLSNPKLAPDKAQYEEINTYLQSISGLIDNLMPDEVLPDADDDAKRYMNNFRTYFKMMATKKLCEVIGIDNIFEVPDLSESLQAQIDIDDYYQVVKNLRNHMLAAKSALDRYENAEDNFQGNDNGMGGDMGFGGDMGMDMGGDMGMGDMGDLGGDMGGNDMSSLNMGPDTGGNNPEGGESGQSGESEFGF